MFRNSKEQSHKLRYILTSSFSIVRRPDFLYCNFSNTGVGVGPWREGVVDGLVVVAFLLLLGYFLILAI